jgi:hypothetical protein
MAQRIANISGNSRGRHLRASVMSMLRRASFKACLGSSFCYQQFDSALLEFLGVPIGNSIVGDE